MPGKNGNRRPDGTFAPKGTGDLTGRKLKALKEQSNALKQAKAKAVKAPHDGIPAMPKPGDKLVSPSGKTKVVSHIHQKTGSIIFDDGGSMTDQMWAIHGHKWTKKESAAAKPDATKGKHAMVDGYPMQAGSHASYHTVEGGKSVKKTAAIVSIDGKKATMDDGSVVHTSNLIVPPRKDGDGNSYMVVGHGQKSGHVSVAVQGKDGLLKDQKEMSLDEFHALEGPGSKAKPAAAATSKPASGEFDAAAHKKKLASLQSMRSVAKKAGNEDKVKELDQKITDHKASAGKTTPAASSATTTPAAAAANAGKTADQKQLASLQSQKSRAKGDPEKIKAIEEKIAALKGKAKGEQKPAEQAKVDGNDILAKVTAEKLAAGSPEEQKTFKDLLDKMTPEQKQKTAEHMAKQKPTAANKLAAAKPLKPQDSVHWPYKSKPSNKAENEAVTTSKSLKNFGEDTSIHDVKVGDVFFNGKSGDVIVVRSASHGTLVGDLWDSKGKLLGRTEGGHETGMVGIDHNLVRLYGASNSQFKYPRKEVHPGVFTGDLFRDEHSGNLLQVDGSVVGVKDRLAVNIPGVPSSGGSLPASKVKELLDKQKNSGINGRAQH